MRKPPSTFRDITGQQFGEWFVWKRGPNRKTTNNTRVQYYCTCKCGTVKLVDKIALERGVSKSCGCVTRPGWQRNKEKFMKPWTEEEKERLRQWYPVNGTQFLESYLGRSKEAIRTMAHYLGVKLGRKKRGNKNWWSDRELDVIRELYPEGGALACKPYLPKRTIASTRAMAKKIGVKCKYPNQSAMRKAA